jgi:excisionase family DNA binding protein
MQTFLTPDEVAHELRLNRRTIIAWLQKGKLPGVKVGGRWRVTREDLDRFIAEGKNR